MNRGSELIQKRKYKIEDGSDGGNGGDGGDGGDAAAAAAVEAAAAAAAEAEANKNKPSDREAELLREVMKRKESEKTLKIEAEAAKAKLAQFDGIDVEQIRTMLREKAEADQNKLIEKGEFERVRVQMVEQHGQEIEKVKGEATATTKQLSENLQAAMSQITELTIGRAFGDSSFVRDTLTLTPSKARVVYGSQFELQDGKIVAYDKPAGSATRTMLVNGSGEPMPFDQAIEKIVKDDPDHEHLIRSTMKPGAGSNNDPGAKPVVKVGSGRDRIVAAVQAGQLRMPK